MAFERDLLCPVAGIDRYDRVRRLRRRGVDHATDDAARRYVDGELDADGMVNILTSNTGMSAQRASGAFGSSRSTAATSTTTPSALTSSARSSRKDATADRWTTFERMLRKRWLVSDWAESRDESGSHSAAAP